jgi:serine/threonine-protein kinase
MVLGTPSFMSPEQLAGQRIDGRSDLYSLGVMLFQLLTGQLPFRGDSMAALMFQIANQPAPDVRDLRPELPAALADILAKTMLKPPEGRYQTGAQLAADLHRVMRSVQETAQAGARLVGADPGQGQEAFEATHVMARPLSAENVAATAADTAVFVREPGGDGSPFPQHNRAS